MPHNHLDTNNSDKGNLDTKHNHNDIGNPSKPMGEVARHHHAIAANTIGTWEAIQEAIRGPHSPVQDAHKLINPDTQPTTEHAVKLREAAEKGPGRRCGTTPNTTGGSQAEKVQTGLDQQLR